MRIALANDHAAYELKIQVKEYLQKKGYTVEDYGTNSNKSVDYPDTIKLAARAVSKGLCLLGVVMCGSGVGASIVANKIRGIRAVLCMDEYTAEYSRKHNNANVLVLAGRRRTMEDVSRYLDIWLSTEYEGERHDQRLDKIRIIEDEECDNA
jgi:ribose 5-phosphate isomerase B